tara:strand:- start:9 stop:347 length:339 start_codon:yes stop_codon:yes gene_type:complete
MGLEFVPAGRAEGEERVEFTSGRNFGKETDILVRRKIRRADLRHDLLRFPQGPGPAEQANGAYDRIEGHEFRRVFQIMLEGIDEQARSFLNELAIERFSVSALLGPSSGTCL